MSLECNIVRNGVDPLVGHLERRTEERATAVSVDSHHLEGRQLTCPGTRISIIFRLSSISVLILIPILSLNLNLDLIVWRTGSIQL